MKYTPKITRVSAGPYAAGDEVTVYATLSGPKGPRGMKSGTVVVSAGGQTARFSGRPRADGSVAIKIKLPPNASSVQIHFEPDPHPFQANESLSSSRSSSRTLTVATCPYRVSVAKPGNGTSVQVGSTVSLVPSVKAVGQGGTPSKLDLTWTLVPAGKAPLTLKSDAQGRASWQVPADLSNQDVTISVGGKADGALACSSGERIVPISELGLGWDTSDLPEDCSVDRSCTGTATLVLPDDPKAKAAVEALLKNPATRIAIYSGETRTEVPVSPDHKYSFKTTSTQQGVSWFRLEVIGPKGQLTVSPHEVKITPGLTLVLPPEIHFGTVPVGKSWHEVCQPLDYSKSTTWEGQSWKLRVEGAEGCTGEPVLMYANAWGQPSQASLISGVETDPHHEMRPIHDICLYTSGCSSETKDGIKLIVTPLDPAYADQETVVKLKWKVEGTSWMWCWGWMLIPIPVVMAALFFLYGFFRPFRFPAHAAIRVASKPGDLKRNAAITLRDLPGSGSGWYRNARLGLHRSGEISKNVAGAVVVLRASKRDVMLDPTVALEARNRRNGKYETVEPLPTAAMPNTIYRAGDVYFKVEV